MTKYMNEPSIRIGQSLINATYVWQGSKYLGYYYWDALDGYWRIVTTDDGEVAGDAEECKEILLNKVKHENLLKANKVGGINNDNLEGLEINGTAPKRTDGLDKESRVSVKRHLRNLRNNQEL